MWKQGFNELQRCETGCVCYVHTKKHREPFCRELEKELVSQGITGKRPYGLSGKEIETISVLDADNSIVSCLISPET